MRIPFDTDAAVSRRTLLKGAASTAALAALPASLVGCGGDDGGSTKSAGGGGGGGKKAVGTVTLGSNASDAVPKASYEKVFADFKTATGGTVDVNTVDHNTFQEQINSYLQGKPDDAFMWFAGYRMQFFAQRGLATEISDVWQKIGPNYSDALKKASTGLDGKQYFVPYYYYPWALFYRKSVWEKEGWEVPQSFDELKALLPKMQKAGYSPLGFADKDGWPAMGTFDILNLRHNGYQFHVDLMAGKESWQDPKVATVFNTWKELLPYHQEGALGRTWQEAAQGLASKKSAMYLLGMFVGQQFTDEKTHADLDFFNFPEIDSNVGADTLDAPIDGFMISKSPKNEDGAKALLEYLASAKAQSIYLQNDPNNIATAKDADTSNYSALQKKAVELVSNASNITQFMDRDTRPDFASTVMIPALQDFIKNPNDVSGLQKKIEDQKKTIFTS
jgi:multiple sugar transport system substrate-binding protein